MLRRSKPDQIEERRSVSSVWAGKSTHGSGTIDCRRVEMRFYCLFLQVQVCLLVILVIFSHSHGWWQHAILMLESILHYHIHRKIDPSDLTVYRVATNPEDTKTKVGGV